ncbi:flagellar export chaperone FlgN [Vannielia litorea]|uniref:FlgN protein n=1 Tax=Vannielia litorea TaxID=1217970 RepID=A0A1N6H069_9RHOB|nr:flagellar export chaperone FlgN [Vannielia litorea]SIO13208.1 FlgN protein [Vannielia litorea]
MADNMELYERAQALMAAEREALKGADFEQLEALYEQKHDLLKEIEARADTLTRSQIEALSVSARGNDRLLDAAQRGLRAVARRLSETRRAAEHLDTYTDKGKRQDLGPVRSSFERRA